MAGAAHERPGSHRDLSASVRYQCYETADGQFVLLMATEAKFWRRFCGAADRLDLFERFPPKEPMSHESGNEELRRELVGIFALRTQGEWVRFFDESDVPGVPVNSAASIRSDDHFRARTRWLDESVHGMPLIANPIRLVEGSLPDPRRAPRVGEHSFEILKEVLRYSPERIRSLLGQ